MDRFEILIIIWRALVEYRIVVDDLLNLSLMQVNELFQYKYDQEENAEFELVDTVKVSSHKGRFGGGRGRWQGRGGARGARTDRGGRGHRGEEKSTAPVQLRSIKDRATAQPQGKKKWNALRKNDRRPYQRRHQRSDRQASVKVQTDWQLVEEYDLPALNKFTCDVPTVEDLQWCGYLDAYNQSNEFITGRHAKKLMRSENKQFYFVTTTADPVIEKLAVEGQGKVFATDAILAHLMSSSRTVYPWDIVIQKVNNTIFFDKRDNSQFDFLTVNETAFDPPVASDDPENINNPDRLSLEATMVNQNFSQQILEDSTNRKTYEAPNPFFDPDDAESGAEPASVAYRYRQFRFADGLTLVARCELHGFVEKKSGNKELMTTYALNEWDSKLAHAHEWRQKIDSQRGAVLGTELKNNSAKLAKWTAQSIIAGADQMKIGYVSRVTRANSYEHAILGSQFFKPVVFARQIALGQSNMWGIIRTLVDLVGQQDDGKFVVMRDPNKPIARVYSVPMSAFESGEDETEDQGQEDSDGA